MSEMKLPRGWKRVTLDKISKFVIGGDWGKDPDKFWGEDFVEVACIRGSEIKNWGKEKGKTASIRLIKESSLEKRELIVGDLLIEISGGGPDQPVGRVVRIDEEALSHHPKLPKVGTNFLRLLRIVDDVDNSYVNYYLQYFYHSGEVVKYQGGSNNLRNLKYKDYSKIDIPLAPLPEQQHIVARLDAVFGHLDVLKEKLDRIPVLLKNFRQQVLTQAVTGELTKEWRERVNPPNAQELVEEISKTKKQFIRNKEIRNEKKVFGISEDQKLMSIPKGWVYIKLGELTIFINGDRGKNYPNRSEYIDDNGVAFINTGHIEPDGSLDINTMNYITQEKYDSLGGGKIRNGDLVYCLRGATLGKTAVITQFNKGAIASSLVIIRPIEGINRWYLYYFLTSSIGRKNIRLYDNGSAQPNLSAESVRNYVIGLPSIEEQEEIVNRVDKLFGLADTIESQYQSLKAKLDQLPQAIFTKAFRGELVDQEVKEYVREVGELGMVAENGLFK